MKRLTIILITLFVFVGLQAQERTVNVSDDGDLKLSEGVSYSLYDGDAADTLVSSNQDTIDLVWRVYCDKYVKTLKIGTTYDLVSGNDTSVAITVSGKHFANDSYESIIASSTSSDINSNDTYQEVSNAYTETIASFDVQYFEESDTTYQFPAQTITPVDNSYRYIRTRYIIEGASGAGNGVKLDQVELKITY